MKLYRLYCSVEKHNAVLDVSDALYSKPGNAVKTLWSSIAKKQLLSLNLEIFRLRKATFLLSKRPATNLVAFHGVRDFAGILESATLVRRYCSQPAGGAATSLALPPCGHISLERGRTRGEPDHSADIEWRSLNSPFLRGHAVNVKVELLSHSIN